MATSHRTISPCASRCQPGLCLFVFVVGAVNALALFACVCFESAANNETGITQMLEKVAGNRHIELQPDRSSASAEKATQKTFQVK